MSSPDSEDVIELDLEVGSYRPALVTLTRDVRALVDEFLRGLDSRRRVLTWNQEVTIRTMGELPDKWFTETARQFRGGEHERALLAALLDEPARGHAFDPADELRERLIVTHVLPAYHRAFRRLRINATEYVDEAGQGDAHDPRAQSFIAMRPALDELETWQQRALRRCLDGLADRSEIVDWGEDLELATHGEIEEGFVARCYRERATANLLTSDDSESAAGRRLFAAHHLLPAFRDGVRELSGRAGEQPESNESSDLEVPSG